MTNTAEELVADRQVPEQIVALGFRDYRWFWGASMVSNTGSMMYMAALNWVVADLHGVTAATLIAAGGLLPMLLSSPIGGALADRYERRRVFLWAVWLQTFSAGALTFAYVMGWTSLATFATLALVGGFTNSVGAPVQQAIIGDLVPPSAVRNASVLNSTQYTVCRALGPTLAGLLLGSFGASTVFWVNTASFLVLIVALRRMAHRPAPLPPANAEGHFAAFVTGCRYTVKHPALRLTLAGGSLLAFVTAPLQLNGQVVARDAFDAGPTAFGLLVGAFGYGALAAALGVIAFDRGWSHRGILTVGFPLLAAGLLGLSVAPSVGLGIVANALVGAAFMLSMSTVASAIHTSCDDEYRGRVMSVWMILWGLSAPLGIMLSGFAALIGIRWVLAIDAAFVVVCFAVMRRGKGLAMLDEPRNHTPAT